MKWILLLIFVIGSAVASAHTPPDGAKVFFIGLKNGDTVVSPVHIKFGIEGFGITPAGTTDKIRHYAGHFHLLVDLDRLPALDEPIPRDAFHIHFDRGEAETRLELLPGRHTLQLLLGDEDHEPHEPPLISERIIIQVE
ncbi:MAG: DUF4399 domain-containing protein [Candidatus Thiodiazotropha sp. (ex Monitilora ramsayi)]|nr:DUF4399 domain-containing protein [Candidatus Thiodiazotropha sp. (ex Monitilora ramsayi)]